jgi:hypothetical protein
LPEEKQGVADHEPVVKPAGIRLSPVQEAKQSPMVQGTL